MKRRKKAILWGVPVLVLLAVLILFLLSRCGGTRQDTRAASAILSAQVGQIDKNTQITVADDSGGQALWNPKAPQAVLAEVEAWLKQAKPYAGTIPKSPYKGTQGAYTGPSILELETSGQHEISVKPAFYTVNAGFHSKTNYLPDVLTLTDGKQQIYIQSIPLYDWLKSGRWKAKFIES